MGAATDRTRLVALALVLCLVATACGSRVSEEAREFVISGAPGTGVVDPGRPGDPADPTLPDDHAFEPLDPETETDPDTGAPRQPGETQRDDDGGTRTDPRQPDGERRDTRHAPPGGNGGATDVGVTEDRIVISNVSDISGAVPGLFEDAQQAVRAYMAMFAATEGTVYGRQIELRARDSRLDTGGNRNAYLQACEDSFAAVGSMSAFDQGAAPVIQECGIPDIRTAATNDAVMRLPTMISPQALSPERKRATEYRVWQEQYGDAVRHAAYLFIDAETTRFQSAQDRRAARVVGYEWIYEQPVDLAETNYAPFVLEMRNRGVRFVQFQGAYQQAVRLAQAMRQQNFWPDVYVLQPNAYTPDFIETGGAAVEGTELLVPSLLLEEIDDIPEMQLYAQWLNRVAPGERPTGLGMYGWAAAKLFVEAIKNVGPELTRDRLIAELRGWGTFDANGLVAPHHIGRQEPTPCVVVVRVQDGRFVRVDPMEGLRCDPDGVVNTG